MTKNLVFALLTLHFFVFAPHRAPAQMVPAVTVTCTISAVEYGVTGNYGSIIMITKTYYLIDAGTGQVLDSWSETFFCIASQGLIAAT